MKLFRLSVISSLLCAACFGGFLFWTSQQVQQIESKVKNERRDIASVSEHIRMLKAEWDYLNAPERLEKLASQYLGMVPSAPKNLSTDFTPIPEELPSMEDASALTASGAIEDDSPQLTDLLPELASMQGGQAKQ
ncbi:MAG: hypothetical protein GC136_00440 [Alphaproteobacteria bacterium]|nr:hypothetical protein [Alphaproteobacteria bacterium]